MIHSPYEYILYAKENGMREADITFVPAESFSPYIECQSDVINQINILESKKIEVNPFYRYEQVFAELLAVDSENIMNEIKGFIFDFWIHEIYKIERLSGMTRKSFEKSYLINEIANGLLGTKVKREFELFDNEEKTALIYQIIHLYSGGDSRVLFCSALKAFLTNIFVYTLNEDKILLFVGEKESTILRKKISFTKDIFLPIEMQVDIFWDRHFGVFEVEETMVLDEIELL